jgi:hypothetical protein
LGLVAFLAFADFLRLAEVVLLARVRFLVLFLFFAIRKV